MIPGVGVEPSGLGVVLAMLNSGVMVVSIPQHRLQPFLLSSFPFLPQSPPESQPLTACLTAPPRTESSGGGNPSCNVCHTKQCSGTIFRVLCNNEVEGGCHGHGNFQDDFL